MSQVLVNNVRNVSSTNDVMTVGGDERKVASRRGSVIRVPSRVIQREIVTPTASSVPITANSMAMSMSGVSVDFSVDCTRPLNMSQMPISQKQGQPAVETNTFQQSPVKIVANQSSTDLSFLPRNEGNIVSTNHAVDAIHQLYTDRDQQMGYLQKYHGDMEKREKKFRMVFHKLSSALDKAQGDIHMLQERESQLRSLCKDFIHEKGTVSNKEDQFWLSVVDNSDTLLGTYESNNNNNSKNTNKSMVNHKYNDLLGIDVNVNAQGKILELQQTNNILLKRIDALEGDNSKLRLHMKSIGASQKERDWQKQRQGQITCIKRIESLVAERTKLLNQKKESDKYTWKLESTVLKLRKQQQVENNKVKMQEHKQHSSKRGSNNQNNTSRAYEKIMNTTQHGYNEQDEATMMHHGDSHHPYEQHNHANISSANYNGNHTEQETTYNPHEYYHENEETFDYSIDPDLDEYLAKMELEEQAYNASTSRTSSI